MALSPHKTARLARDSSAPEHGGRRCASLWLFPLLLALLFSDRVAAGEAFIEQTFRLEPGWNAIYLQVTPTEKDIEANFAGLPIRSVWRWIPEKSDQAEFIRDPAEGLAAINGWYGYYPQPRPEAFLTNLFTLKGNQAYLIQLDGDAALEWTVRGKPQFRKTKWRSNAFNLVGFNVLPDAPPTFGEYFEYSPAHAGQPIFTLGADGKWQEIANPYATPIDPLKSYWVYCEGRSKYQGPTEITLESDTRMEFAAQQQSQRLIIENHASVDNSVIITRGPNGGSDLPLMYENIDPETGESAWPVFQQYLARLVDAERELLLNLGVDRASFNDDRMEQILWIEDGIGMCIPLLLGADTVQPLGPAAVASRTTRAVTTATNPHAGLWIGVALVDAVSESQLAGTVPTPTGRSFPLRFIIHIDNAGQARLLKDVIQMWEEGTYKPSAADPTKLEVDTPGRYVLITDPDLIPDYTGAVVRDGTPVGVRYSTVAYDFEGEQLEFLPEQFDAAGTLSVGVRIAPDHPTNPFLHRYHPDHDNLDRQFLNFSEEAFEVIREIVFDFEAKDPTGANPPGWGDAILGGYYRETITGLHRNAIFVEGGFRMKRISAVATLNQ